MNKIYSVGIDKRSGFNKLWQQHKTKEIKTMEMSEGGPDIYDKVYIHQLQPGPTYKIQQ